MPYSFSALGVLPPLWSSAAMKPAPLCIFLNWSLFMANYLPGWRHSSWRHYLKMRVYCLCGCTPWRSRYEGG